MSTWNEVSVLKDIGLSREYRATGRADAENLYHRDDAILYIAYVMLIWAAPIPADRWHCSLWP